jgi:uncharacterized membrane protein
MSETTEAIYADVVRVLRAGFRVAAAFLVVGLVIAVLRKEPLEHKTDPLPEIPSALIHLHSSAFIDLAIIAIALTPVAAVMTIALGFRRTGEMLFAKCAAGVLLILMCSIALSLIR